MKVLLEPYRVPVEVGSAPVRGNPKAPVTIVEFSDFQCPYCVRARPTVNRVRETYGDKVRWVFRHFPLDFHAQAEKAGEAAACAGEQGKFWEMHDLLWANTGEAAGRRPQGPRGDARPRRARRSASASTPGRHAGLVESDLEAGQGYGVSGTPAFFVNGRPLVGAQPFDAFAQVIDDELQRAGDRVPRGGEVSAGPDRRPDWLRWAQRLQAIAQTGLTYAQRPLRPRAVRGAAEDRGGDGRVRPRGPARRRSGWPSRSSLGYPTPKVDVRAVVFRGAELLLVRERRSGRWTFPGGWADAGDTPVARRRAGDPRGERLPRPGGEAARAPRQVPPRAPALGRLHVQGADRLPARGRRRPVTSHEIDAVGFFARAALPELDLDRTTPGQVELAWAHLADPSRPTDFD